MRSSSRWRPELWMSCRYSSCRSLMLAEHPLEEHLGEPEHRVERRPELVGHAGEELRLVPAGELQLEALLLELAEELGVLQGQGGLARERLQQVERLLGEVAGPLAADDERPDDACPRAASAPRPASASRRRTGSGGAGPEGRRPGPARRSVGVPWRRARRGSRPRRCGSSAAARRRRAPCGRRCGPGRRGPASAYSMIEPPSVSDSSHRVPGDGGEHAVDVEAGVDRLADLLQRLELLDLLRQLGAPGLELLDQLDRC